MKGIKEASKRIADAGSIVIAGHVNPDGDSIGSLLSLGIGIESLGKKVYMISQDGVPVRYASLPGAGRIKRHTDKRCDLGISVDCSSKEILGRSYKALKKAGSILEIDHHESRRPFGSIRLVESRAASVGEMIYVLLNRLNVRINPDIAQNILTSIVVETNSFRLPNVRPETFDICSKLMDIGIDFHKLVETVYWSRTKEAIIISGICLSRTKFLRDGKIAWSVVRAKDFRRTKSRDEDLDPLADEIRTIGNVEIAAFFREKSKSKLRVSLRSKKVDVANVAEAYGGGGHFDVAGCTIPNTSKAIKGLLNNLERIID